MIRTAVLGALCAIVASSGAALADGPQIIGPRSADPYSYVPPPEQLFYNWSGFYFGGHIGNTWSTDRSRLIGAATDATPNGNAFSGGVQGGYQHQFRELVLGVDVTHSWSGVGTNFNSTTPAGLSLSTRVDDVTTVSGRMGYAYMNWLAYWKAGWASASVETTARGLATGTVNTRGNGWVGGIGLAHAFGPNIIGGIEYDYVRINSSAPTLAPGVVEAGSGHDLQTVMLRLEYKFGR